MVFRPAVYTVPHPRAHPALPSILEQVAPAFALQQSRKLQPVSLFTLFFKFSSHERFRTRFAQALGGFFRSIVVRSSTDSEEQGAWTEERCQYHRSHGTGKIESFLLVYYL